MAQTATVQIEMPEMGESVTEGIVLEWHVAEGDFVKEGDTVVEISTDKVDAEVPAPTDGVITKLIAQVDEEVPVGAPLAEMEPGEGRRDRRGFRSLGCGSCHGGGACGRCSGSVLGPSPAPPAGEPGNRGRDQRNADPMSGDAGGSSGGRGDGRRPWCG